jgi:hypothetical protein
MAKDNIYDLSISEIVLRLGAIASLSSNTVSLVITSDIGATTIPEIYNDTHVFTSTVNNMPLNYTVKGSTHTILTPATPFTTTGSSTPLSTIATAVSSGSVGTTIVVTSSVTIEDLISAGPEITLNATHTITSVVPTWFGLKPYEVTPDLTGLTEMSGELVDFTLTSNTTAERLNIAIPTTNNGLLFKGVTIEPNHSWIPVTDFTRTTVGAHELWVLNYDTMLNGTHNKNFTIKFD